VATGPILVVDDDDAIRDLMEMVLGDEGYEVVSVGSGPEALDRIHERRPELILLDMRMPGMNGWEFAEAYRRLPGPHAPIVVVTAGRNPDQKARDVDAVAYLAKPFDLDELGSLVGRVLGRAA
jgi:CheY-like chemotaxis protein